MEGSTPELEPVAAPVEVPPEIRGAPPPRSGGPLTLLRFLRARGMLNLKYAHLALRLALRKLWHRRGLALDGLAFIGPGCTLQIGRKGRIELGRWSWVGHGTKLRCHEGVISLGAKSVLGQECTVSAFQHVSIGRECVIADRVMLIDFDHGVVDVDRPVRLQGIYKRDVRIGNNVWIGYGACVLRGVTVGDNAVIGTNAVVTRDVPENAVVAGVPARVVRMREPPQRLRWS
jgi:acetyltransferase-like isoleucine patch superfamily enzyme